MPFGPIPKYNEEISNEGLNRDEYLGLATQAVHILGWELASVHQQGLVAYTKDALGLKNEEIRVIYDENAVLVKSRSISSRLHDFEKNRKNVRRFAAKMQHLKRYQPREEWPVLPPMPEGEEGSLQEVHGMEEERAMRFWEFFKPVPGYFITPILINLNILIFLLMVLSGVNAFAPGSEDLLRWGADFRPATLDGQWWRLITNCFVHIGILHLVMNMYALLYIGMLLEPLLGRARYLAAYLLTGLTASLASLWWHDFTVSAGASGAIFGMYGVFLALLTTNLVDKSARQALLASISVFVIYNLVFGMKGGVDNAAHIGGLIGGLCMGYAFYPALRKPEAQGNSYSMIGALTVLVIGLTAWLYNVLPNNVAQYDTRMKQLGDMEAHALRFYNMQDKATREELLAQVRDSGLYYWKESIRMVNGLDSLDLPQPLRERSAIMGDYFRLRLKSFNLIYKALDENTDQYKDSLEFYNQEIEKTVKQLQAE